MPLDQNAINELKRIHFQEFGEELSDQEALDMGISLLRLFKALGRNCGQRETNGPDNLTGERKILYD